DGNLVNGPAWDDSCKYGGCLVFDGTNDYVQISDSGKTPLDVTHLTVSAWVKTTGTSTSNMVLNKENTYELAAGTEGISLAVSATGCNEPWCNGWMIQDAGKLENNSWHHVAGTWNGDVGRVYLDGRLIAENDPAEGDGPVNNTNEDTGIGARDVEGSPSSFFNGQIDDVRVYSRALTGEQIQTLASAPSQSWKPFTFQVRSGHRPSPASLVGSYSFEGTTQAVRDTSDSGNNGQIPSRQDIDTLRWSTAAAWDRAVSQSNVVHDSEGDHPGGGTVQLGYTYNSESNMLTHLTFDSGCQDVSGNNNDCSEQSGNPTSDAGILGTNGYYFDGSDGIAISGITASSTDPYPSGATMLAWVKLTGSSDGDRIFTFDCSEYWCLTTNSGTDFTACIDSATCPSTSLGSLNYGNWQLVGFRYDAANNDMELWINGNYIGKFGNTADPPGSGSCRSFTIMSNTEGCPEASGGDPSGYVDGARFYDNELSGSRMSEIYNTAFSGSITTDWRTFDDRISLQSLQLTDVNANLNNDQLTVYVEADTDGDGNVEQTSNGISLDGSGGPYDVSGLTANAKRFRLRAEFNSDSPATTPQLSGFSLEGEPASPERVTGYSGRAMRFDGESDYVSLGTVEGLPTGDRARTMCAWTYTTQDKRGAIIHQGPDGVTDGNFDLEANVYANGGSTNYYGIHYWGGGVRFDQQVVLDEWVHVCISHEGGNLNNTNTDAYINGESVPLLDTASINTASANVDIGNEPQNDANDVWYAGRIDEVRLYSTALSQQQISQLVSISDFTEPLTNSTGISFGPSGPQTQFKLNLLTGDSASLPAVEQVTLAKTSDWSQWFDAGSNNALTLPPGRFAQVQTRMTSSDPTETPVLDSLSLGKDLALGSQSLFRRGTTVNTQADTSPGFLATGDSNRTDSSLVGYWRFEDIDGNTILDASGSRHHGTFHGTEINGTLGTGNSIDPSDPRWVPNCKRDGCLSFDGTDDFINVTGYSMQSDTRSFAFWFKGDTVGNAYRGNDGSSYSAALLGEGSFGDDWYVEWRSNGNLELGLHEGGSYTNFLISDNFTDTDNWHFIAGTFQSGGQVKVWLDGKLKVDSTLGTWNAGSNHFWIGKWTSSSQTSPNSYNQYFDGKIDEVKVYDTTISAEDIEKLMQGQPVGKPVLYTTLDAGYGQTAYNTAFQAGGIKAGSAIKFDGSDDYVTIDTNVSGRGDFAASAWVKFNEINTDPGNLGSTVIRTNNDDFQWAIYGGNNDIRAYLNPWTGSSDSTILTYGGVQPG
ncbi:MAG: LamG domain-containing protein, partial [Candidatus Nanohaloarchaea archaeon]|nr:LamG domain-containing protein [Candidatus Nanohaloarchaea archaeon]